MDVQLTHVVSKPFVDVQLSWPQCDSSALRVLVKPSESEFYPKIISKWRKKIKNLTSQMSRFHSVSGCAVKHFTVLCQWLPLQHSEPASFTACDQNTHSGPLGFSHVKGQRNTSGSLSTNVWAGDPCIRLYSSCNVLPPYLQNDSGDPQTTVKCI